MTASDPVGRALLEDIAGAVRDVPGVLDAVAVARRRVRPRTAPAVPAPRPAAEHDPGGPAADLDGGPLEVPEDWPENLQEALRTAAEQAPGKGTVFITRDHDDTLQTYAALLSEAERVLAGLRSAGLRPGDAALFQFDGNRAFLTTFWACVLGGFVPTPVAVATTYEAPNETNRKLHNAWTLLGRPVLITEAATAGTLASVRRLWSEPDVRILTFEELAAHGPDTAWYPAEPGTPVLNLLTSGSTGVPKCVQHTHASVTARSLAVARHCGLGPDDVSLIWMPYDHVTVAFYNVRDVFLKCLHVNAKIEHFLADPLLWLEWADRYRATATWAPNFAFALVNEHAEAIRERPAWDLSRLREIVNGGEPVIAATAHRFLELLAPHGLPADAMRPAWGMSETCSGVTYTRQHRDDPAAGTVTIDPASLGGTVREAAPGEEHAVVLSAVGRPIPGVEIRVVADDGTVLPEYRVGELLIRGRTMMRGYHANAEANREAFTDDGWMRTGDLAFVRGGELVIAGRKKDQIIVRGINYMAHEIEHVAEGVDGVRVTFAAAAGIREPGADSDRLAIFFVPERWDTEELDRTAAEVRATLVTESGLAPDLLVPVTEAEFPKTGSGKIQRAALVAAFREGRFTDRVLGSGPREETDGWLFRREWAELPPAAGTAAAAGVRLVLAEDEDLERLGLGPSVVTARRGAYGTDGPRRHRVTADDRGELRRLLTEVTAAHGPITEIVFALPLSQPGRTPLARLTAVTAEFSALVAALEETGLSPLLLTLTAGSVHVSPGDRIDLGSAALPGLLRTAAAEAPRLVLRQADLPADPGEWAAAVQGELADRDHSGVVAIRAGRRLRPLLCPADDDGPAADPPALVTGGRYLVTGGLGGIGYEIARRLLTEEKAVLLLVGRSPAGRVAGRLAELAALGDVEYHRCDVADLPALRAAVDAAEARWGGPLDGVLHLAAADATGQWAHLDRHMIARESAATFAEQYRAKVAGTLAVAEILETRPDASLILFGSVNGEFGGHSFGAYSAANSFVAGFAEHWHHERRRTVHCLAWSIWSEVGVNHGQPTEPGRQRGFRIIGTADGLRVFREALARPGPYTLLGLDVQNPAIVAELVPDRLLVAEVLVAYTGAGADAERIRAAVASRTGASPVPVRVAAVPNIPRDARGETDVARLLLEAAPRRTGRTAGEPATELELRIARIWSEALDRPEVGRDESFFELGGNSIRAFRLIALVNDELGTKVGPRELYENPTVAGMATAINEQAGVPAER
ncbi:SDR family NAD(P)-dependent oxidoreductase [Actinocorallia longicatena]|uniref:Carrier domain-containing protein n=1 Tax=Actinocorallia longicatena TaxID=111803 RepID=A0ABP6QKG9_9ACTN